MTVDAKVGKPTQRPTDKIAKFFREVRAELKKTVWPTRKELISSTGIVLVTVVAVSVLIACIDLVCSSLMSLIL